MKNEGSEPKRPEIIVGLVGAVGTDLETVCKILNQSFKDFHYNSETIYLSKILKELDKEGWPPLKDTPEDERIKSYMTRGNLLRECVGRGDALAILSLNSIQQIRQKITGDDKEWASNYAFILKSLKHPEEVKSLRKIYGPNFILISVYFPRDKRIQKLSQKIGESHQSSNSTDFLSDAEKLNRRDEAEEVNKFGQNVRETFPLADVFIDASDFSSLQKSLSRFLDLVFNHPFHTPTKDELAMKHAYISAFRSASLSRQVGAVITTLKGDIIATGTNEVPKAGGGLYWCEDKQDHRDFVYGSDISDKMRKNVLGEILRKLKEANWLSDEKSKKEMRELLEEALIKGDPPLMRRTQIMNIIEFGRAVHAEMSALCEAACRGISVNKCVLYSTTFPCHECARHIVASGINRVVYIEPYPKSLVTELYPDSIQLNGAGGGFKKVIFTPFVGVAPRLYERLFQAEGKRAKIDGEIVPWDKCSAVPIILDFSQLNILTNEITEINGVNEVLEKQKIIKKKGGK